jgi:hypothetical protein
MADSDQELSMGVLTVVEVQRVLEKDVSELRNLDCILEKKLLSAPERRSFVLRKKR